MNAHLNAMYALVTYPTDRFKIVTSDLEMMVTIFLGHSAASTSIIYKYYVGVIRHNQQCEKNEMVLGRAPSTASKMTNGPHGDHTTRKDDMGDQPSGGETTWTNTGAARPGRGQHKTG